MSEFLQQEQLRLELAPQQLALAVRDGDMEQLVLAMRAASSMWGGRRFPILTVNDDGVTAPGDQLLDILQVTTVIDFSGTLVDAGAVRSAGRSIPVGRARPLDDAEQWRPSAVVSHTLEALEGKQLLEARADDPVELAAFGRLACREEVAEWAGFGATVALVTPTNLVAAQLARAGVIDVTVHGLLTSMMSDALLRSAVLVYVVGDDATFDDLVWFWNARALRPGDEGADVLVRQQDLLNNADMLVEHVRRTVYSMPALALNSLSVPREELQELLSQLGVPDHEGRVSESIFAGTIDEVTGAVNFDVRAYWSGPRETGAISDVVTALYSPTTTVEWPGPLPFASRFTGVNPVDLRIRSAALKGPRTSAVAKLYHRNAEWLGDSLRLSSGLFSRYQLQLNFPRPEQVLTGAVALPYKGSDKARQLRAVLAREGNRLDLYRDPVALAVIEALTPSDSRRLARLLEGVEEDDRDFIRAAAAALREPLLTLGNLAANPGELAPGASASRRAEALNRLVERGRVHRGLRADCSLCDQQDLRQLDQAASSPTCHACGAQAVYHPGPSGEPELFYRLSSVMRIISANGGLPVLAAAAVLIAEGAHVQPGAEAQTDGEKFEVDLLGWRGSELFAGEVKRSASGFRRVERDVRATARFGAGTHIAATLDVMPDEVRADLEAACDAENVQLRVLDRRELLLRL